MAKSPLKYAKLTMSSGTTFYYAQQEAPWGNRSIEADIHAHIVGNDTPTMLVYTDETLTGKKIRANAERIEFFEVIGPIPES